MIKNSLMGIKLLFLMDGFGFSVPIKKEHKFSLNRMVEINNDIDWKENHLEKLQKSYANSNFFISSSNIFTNEVIFKKFHFF